MSFPQVSYPTREFCRNLLKNTTVGFNYWITQTASSFGVPSFQLSDQSSRPSLYLGRYDYPTLLKSGANFSTPVAVLSVAKADNTSRQNLSVTPSSYSGQVVVSLDFYIPAASSGSMPPDGEAMYFAIESALVAAFNSPTSYGLMPPGTTYNNEIQVEQGAMEFDGTRWVQWIPVSMFFYQVS